MIEGNLIGAAIPCYRGNKATLKTVLSVIEYVDWVVFIDDCCPYKTGAQIKDKIKEDKLFVIYNQKNIGVGGSTKKGFKWLLDKGCDIILKIDADGQLRAEDIPKMCMPIIKDKCDATKGNRFTDIDKLYRIPRVRLIGNIFLGFITKLSTGYWEIFDPTNGFIAFSSTVLKEIELNKTDNRYFFETDVLFRCALKNIIINNVAIEPIYKENKSSLKPFNEITNFFIRHIKLTFKRILYQYFLLDFNPGSIELVLSIIIGGLSFIIGLTSLYKSNSTGIIREV